MAGYINFLQGKLCLWYNIANNIATKQTRNKQKNQQTGMKITDRCCIPFEGKWAVGNINMHIKEFASIFACVTIFYSWLNAKENEKIYNKAYIPHYGILIFRLQLAVGVMLHKVYQNYKWFQHLRADTHQQCLLAARMKSCPAFK